MSTIRAEAIKPGYKIKADVGYGAHEMTEWLDVLNVKTHDETGSRMVVRVRRSNGDTWDLMLKFRDKIDVL